MEFMSCCVFLHFCVLFNTKSERRGHVLFANCCSSLIAHCCTACTFQSAIRRNMRQIRANNNTFPRSARARIAAMQNMHVGLVWSDGLLLLALAHFFRAVCCVRQIVCESEQRCPPPPPPLDRDSEAYWPVLASSLGVAAGEGVNVLSQTLQI